MKYYTIKLKNNISNEIENETKSNPTVDVINQLNNTSEYGQIIFLKSGACPYC